MKEKRKKQQQQQQRKNKQRQKRAWVKRSYSGRVRPKRFCCVFKLGFLQLICKVKFRI